MAGHGWVTLLVNNAGVALMGDFEQATLDDFEWLFGINFCAPVRPTRAFLPVLRQQPVAQIVNVPSVFGVSTPPGQTACCAANFALRGFSEALRHKLGTTGKAWLSAVIDPAGAARAAKQFATTFITTAEQAAARTVVGIKKREKRILIGRDVGLLDVFQRLTPTRYRALTRKRAGQRPRSFVKSIAAQEQTHG